MRKKLKIYISGGTGFIGSKTSLFLKNKYLIRVTDEKIADVTNFDSLKKDLANFKPDVVIAFAGIMGANNSKNNIFNTININAVGTLNLLEAMKLNNIKNIIFISSLTVHGENNKPLSELSIYKSKHPYSTSKIISELILNDYAKFNNFNSIILRPTIVVGNFKGEPNAFNEFLESNLKSKDIIIYGNGKHKRCYLHVDDVNNAIDKSLLKLKLNMEKKTHINETYIISSNEPISMIDLAKKINLENKNKIIKIKKNIQSFNLYGNSKKAKKELNWKPKFKIDQLIKKIRKEIT